MLCKNGKGPRLQYVVRLEWNNDGSRTSSRKPLHEQAKHLLKTARTNNKAYLHIVFFPKAAILKIGRLAGGGGDHNVTNWFGTYESWIKNKVFSQFTSNKK